MTCAIHEMHTGANIEIHTITAVHVHTHMDTSPSQHCRGACICVYLKMGYIINSCSVLGSISGIPNGSQGLAGHDAEPGHTVGSLHRVNANSQQNNALIWDMQHLLTYGT